MNEQYVKALIESHGQHRLDGCWEIVNQNSQDIKYFWIIEHSSLGSQMNTKSINFTNTSEILYAGTKTPTGFEACFEFRTDRPVNGVMSKITCVQPSSGRNNGNLPYESEWINCENAKKYCYLSNEKWKFSGLQSIMIQTLTIQSPNQLETIYQNCIVVFIEFAPKTDNFLAICEEQEREHGALVTSKLFDSKEFADVELVVMTSNEDGKVEHKIKAHKNILAVGSSVFKTMFETDMVEKSSSVIEIVDFEPEIIEELLKYLYTGKANLVDHAEQLLRCADKYDVQVLVDLCQKYIGKNISTFGFIGILGMLHLYEVRVPILKKFAEEYFKLNEILLNESEEFRSGVQLYPKEFLDMYLSKKRKREE